MTNCFISDLKIGDYFSVDNMTTMHQVTSVQENTLTAVDICTHMNNDKWWKVKPQNHKERVFDLNAHATQYDLISIRRENYGTDTNLKTGEIQAWVETVYQFKLSRTWDDWRHEQYIQKLSKFIDTCLSNGQSIDEIFEGLNCYQSALSFNGLRVLRTLEGKYNV